MQKLLHTRRIWVKLTGFRSNSTKSGDSISTMASQSATLDGVGIALTID
jgi:hypothetical protein